MPTVQCFAAICIQWAYSQRAIKIYKVGNVGYNRLVPDLYVKKSKTETLKPVKPAEKPGVVALDQGASKSDIKLKEQRDKKNDLRDLTAFFPVPDGAKFETQEEKEEIALFLRAHVIVNLRWIFIAILMLVAPVLARFIPVFSFLPTRFLTIGLLFWYLVTIAFVFEQFLDWYFDVYIVTNERVVDVDFLNLLYKKVSEAELPKIEDVTYTIGGVARSLFNYGDVYIQTAAEVPEFVFEAVPQPSKVTAVIRALMSQERNERGEGGGE